MKFKFLIILSFLLLTLNLGKAQKKEKIKYQADELKYSRENKKVVRERMTLNPQQGLATFINSNKELKNVLDTTNEKLVSVDFNHNSNSAIVDLSLTSVVGDNMGKVSAWYDNEWGFASRVNDLVEYIHNI